MLARLRDKGLDCGLDRGDSRRVNDLEALAGDGRTGLLIAGVAMVHVRGISSMESSMTKYYMQTEIALASLILR